MNTFITPTQKEREWIQSHEDTADLIQAVMSAAAAPSKFTAETLVHLFRLTWVTRGDNHWKVLKAPALAYIFRRELGKPKALNDALARMKLPSAVAETARSETGIVNFRNPYRNSIEAWSAENRA